MLLLTSVSDLVQLGLSTAGPIHVHASWVDVTNAGVITPGRKNTLAVAAGFVIVVPAPPASTQRNLKSLHIRNLHTTLDCSCQVIHYDGTTSETLLDVFLKYNRPLQFTDQGGFKIN